MSRKATEVLDKLDDNLIYPSEAQKALYEDVLALVMETPILELDKRLMEYFGQKEES